MKAKPFWIIIAFLIWGSGSTYWYVCKIKGFCSQKQLSNSNIPGKTSLKDETKQVKKPVVQHDLIYYKKNQSEAIISDTIKWSAEIKSIAQLKAEGKKLRIEAPYYANEIHDTFKNLGLLRAKNLKKLFSSVLDTSLIITESKLIKQDSIPEYFNGYKGFVKWINYNKFVKENQEKTFIYFPVNSTHEIRNSSIIKYLNELADNMKKYTGYKIKITGYTDNIGSKKRNNYLGLLRAKRIKNLLLEKGVDENRIIIASEGENNPIANNNTVEGRQKNRRVEIEIIQNQ